MDGDTGRNARTIGSPKGRSCSFCGTSMDHRHCKYIYPEYGAVYDCNDMFW